MEGRVIGWGIAAVIIACLIGYKVMERDEQVEQFRHEMVQHISSLPDFDTHGSLYIQWFDTHHEHCFTEHYDLGSRRRAPSFDGDAYMTDIFNAMVTDAVASGYKEQADHLRTLQDALDYE